MLSYPGIVGVASVWLLVCATPYTYTQIVITEIMYDPPQKRDTGYEWIEIMNDGQSAVDVTEYRLLEGKVRHRIKTFIEGRQVLEPGDIGVIVQDADIFLAEYPRYLQSVFTSSFSLRQKSNIGEPLGIQHENKSTAPFTVVYTPSQVANGTGATIHLSGRDQISAPATPGSIAINPIIVSSPSVKKKEKVQDAPVPKAKTSTVTKQVVPAQKTIVPPVQYITRDRDRYVLWLLGWIATALTLIAFTLLYLVVLFQRRGRRG